ncbi:MAG TPA: ATP-dependent helicase HrpB [Desulfuromonadales bacterium]|nr:ATP-dependent helicase HrpB [Desulfuromonadales bacterium]
MIHLPIEASIPALLETIRTHQNSLLHAPPGAGKTTRVPLALLSLIPAEAGRIVMLEPRRIAAVSAARWMASRLGEEVGRTIGYSIRFESRTSAATRIEVVTEGILTRRIQSDPTLEGVALVIYDEFHERSIHADLGLALCRDVQRQLRPDLKILIMSATLDIAPLAGLLGDAPLVSSAGRSFPVEDVYLEESAHTRLPQRMASTVLQILRKTEGDILAFLPGAGEIRQCARLLAESDAARHCVVMPLYGDLPISDQQKVLLPSPQRKIVLATSIAETSLTIDGVRVVIDSGLSRRLQFDPANGLNRLVTVRESRASADQRRGRAGRTAPGVCYRLFSRHTLNAMTPHSPPEICVTDISQLLLELAAWGICDPTKLDWLDPPPEAAQHSARTLLTELDAFDTAGRITPLGKLMVQLPLHPRLGRLLLRSRELGCTALGCDVASLLSERDIFRKNAGHAIASTDIFDRVEALQRWRKGRYSDDRLDDAAAAGVDRVARQLAQLMADTNAPTQPPEDMTTTIARLLITAYPDRIARRRPTDTRHLLVTGRGALPAPHCQLQETGFIVATSLDGGSQADALIHSAIEISEQLVREERARHISWMTTLSWNEREGRVTAVRQELLGAVPLATELFVPTAEELAPVVIDAVRRSGLALLDMSSDVRQLQGRMLLVRSAFPEEEWPDVSDAALTYSLDEWLAPRLNRANSAGKLARLDICALLKESLDYRRQQQLERLAPTHLQVPSGSRVRLDYSADEPVLAVKLQELFGLAETPTLCGGRIPVLLHLLSPAGRPLQVTRDLKGFWDGAYQQVKKEMKGRYPRHPWPDDPWTAAATRRTKPRT